MSSKQLVKAFYDSDLANDSSIVSEFFHKDCELHWTSSHGFALLKYIDVVTFFDGIRKSYNNLRFEFTHIVEANEFVATRHTLCGNTIEDPDLEISLGHFSALWEVKNHKLYRCYEISQKVDENDSVSMNSYQEIKI